MSVESETHKLNRRQQVFVEEYLRCFNASEAARRAGYKGKPSVIGARLLADVSIKAAFDARLKELHMGTDEALKLLADQARGDIGDFMDISSVGYNFDLMKAREKGITKLIKKIKQKTVTRIGKKDDDDDIEITELEIELYDAQSAIDKILKVSGALKDSAINITVTMTDD